MQMINNAISGIRVKLENRKQPLESVFGAPRDRYSVSCLSQFGVPVESTETKYCDEAIRKLWNQTDVNKSDFAKLEISIDHGIQVYRENGEVLVSHELENIPYCAVSEDHPQIFTFLGEHSGKMLCHICLCTDEKEAFGIFQTVSMIFKQAGDVKKEEEKHFKSRISWYSKDRGFPFTENVNKESRQREMKRSSILHCDNSFSEAKSLMDDQD